MTKLKTIWILPFISPLMYISIFKKNKHTFTGMSVSKYVLGVDTESFYIVNWRSPPYATNAFLRSGMSQLGTWLQHVRVESVPLPFGRGMVKRSRYIHQGWTFAGLYQGLCIICFRGTAALFCRRLEVLHGYWIITVFRWIDYHHIRVFLW